MYLCELAFGFEKMHNLMMPVHTVKYFLKMLNYSLVVVTSHYAYTCMNLPMLANGLHPQLYVDKQNLPFC